MNTTTFSVSGSLDARKSHPVLRSEAPQSTERLQAIPVAVKHAGWMSFANHYATWVTAGRLPLNA